VAFRDVARVRDDPHFPAGEVAAGDHIEREPRAIRAADLDIDAGRRVALQLCGEMRAHRIGFRRTDEVEETSSSQIFRGESEDRLDRGAFVENRSSVGKNRYDVRGVLDQGTKERLVAAQRGLRTALFGNVVVDDDGAEEIA